MVTLQLLIVLQVQEEVLEVVDSQMALVLHLVIQMVYMADQVGQEVVLEDIIILVIQDKIHLFTQVDKEIHLLFHLHKEITEELYLAEHLTIKQAQAAAELVLQEIT
jgi:hypothetical protein